jgi:aminomethyltransferase
MKKTKFYNIHQKLGAKLVEFAGYLMPIQYSSIIAEHKAVRNSVGAFDVSHMGEISIIGEKALEFVQHVTTNDASLLSPERVQYSAMCYPDGGIVDDLLVYRLADDEFMFVVNASNIEKDFNWMNVNNNFGIEINNQSDDYSLLAVQGQNSKEVVQKVCNKRLDLEYYHFMQAKIAGIDMVVSRTGYTGELGYELYFIGDERVAVHVWDAIFEAGKKFDIKPIGLAARDSLRLEMGYCLYGNDIDQTTNPLEAGLGWITKFKKQEFIAKDMLIKVKADGLKRKLVPLITEERAFPRKGYDISANGRKVGVLTSGTVSPTLDKAIALGYVETQYTEENTNLNIIIREKEIPAKVARLPFVEK